MQKYPRVIIKNKASGVLDPSLLFHVITAHILATLVFFVFVFRAGGGEVEEGVKERGRERI